MYSWSEHMTRHSSELLFVCSLNVAQKLDWSGLEDDTGCDTFYYGVFNPSDS